MKLNNLRVGARLGGGFAVILGLLVLMLLISVWRFSSNAAETRSMMQVPLTKERLTEEWFRSVAVGVTRGKAIAKSSDPSLEDLFSSEVKNATARGNEITQALQALPTGAQEQALLDTVNSTRKAYIDSRDTMMKAKRAGHADEANRIYDTDFTKAAPLYVAAMQAYLDYQRKAIDIAAAGIDAEASRSKAVLSMIGGLALLLGVGFAWTLTRSITRPVAEASRLADAVARGDLSQDIAIQGRDEIAGLMHSLGRMNASLRDMVRQVRNSTDSIGTAGSEIATGNQDLSARTEQTAANLQQAASSMEELTGTVMQSAASARQANQLASSAAEVAGRGGKVVAEVVATMQDINSSSHKIADIIGVIDGIAFQTNILALNAAVEAARAGEQGRGFAVVASEVRSLAQRSASAAKEIKGLIDASVSKVENGSRLVADAGKTMQEIVGSVQRVSDIIGEITTASSEQSEGIGQINGSVSELDKMTQQNAALVEESAAAAESLKEQTQRLAEVVGTFKIDAAPRVAA
ncbi:MAG TPA: methyl-accepting chemotaxis protein [Burkholderiaceae bacterium]|jgi:methyl-accepting chemotaxis protein